MARKRRFKITVNEEWCKGCGFCVEFCPNEVYEMGEDAIAHPVHEERCIGCYYSCEDRCPDFAIEIKEVTDEEEEKQEMEDAVGQKKNN
ncbi:4Fe-4S binding protein [candidate division WOR-3 bacterium]|nr:4Fe-4S binding protein [candidate division WOR-3 bacterium]